ncbi:MAG: ABC transporter substrate-binding protein [Thermoanaerobacteraceae bacterium]|nr:ABC transporter substrate-binding protein [Thermoanaerobacteraceae bacterium]
MKRFKMLSLLLVAILVVGLTAGCGGGGQQSNNTNTQQEQNAQPQQNPEPVTITYRAGKDTSERTQMLIKQFEEENPNIKVDFQEMPWSTDDQHNAYVTALQAQDSSIDVVAMDVIWTAEFASAGWLLPLGDKFPQSERDKFLSGPLEAVTYNGEIYALPEYTDAGVLYYRKDIISTPPQTWEELMEMSKENIGKNGIRYGIVFQGNQYEGLVCDALEFIHGNGGDVLDSNGNVVLNSPQSVEGLKEMVSLVEEKIAPEGVTTYMEEDARNVFQQGDALFMRNWPYAWAVVNGDDSPVKGKVGIAPLPHGPNGKAGAPTLGGWNLAVSKYSKHPDEAYKFIEFMCSDAGQKTTALVGGNLPTRKAIYNDPEVLAKNPFYKDLFNAFISARPRPVSPFYPQISDSMQINFHKALTGNITAEEAIANVEKDIKSIMGK